MIKSWSAWKRFPHAHGGYVEAPIGPGVYEVRHASTGQLIAFGYSASVANSLSSLKLPDGDSVWSKMFRRETPVDTSQLEYRTFATASRADARTAAQRLTGLRQTYWRRRMVADWASGQPA